VARKRFVKSGAAALNTIVAQYRTQLLQTLLYIYIYIYMTITHTDLRAKLFSSVVDSSSVYYLYISVYTVRSYGVMCGGGDIFFSPSQPTPRGKTGTAAHSARTYTRRRSKGIDLYIWYTHTDIRTYILYIGVIIVVSTKTNNFTPITCVFPAIWKYWKGRPCPCAAAAPGYQTSPRDDGVEPSPRRKLALYHIHIYIYTHGNGYLISRYIYVLFRRPGTKTCT